MTTVEGRRPISPALVRRASEPVLALPGADAVEVVLTASETALTRYARSEIIQNTVRSELRAQIRVVAGNQVAVTATNQLDAESMERAAGAALAAARTTPSDPDFPGLPSPEKVGRAEALMRWDDATATASPEVRASQVDRLLRASGADNAAGVFETSSHRFGIVNSLGIECWDAYTRCITTCLVDEGGTGWGEQSSHSIADIDVETVARRAATKARTSVDAGESEPGSYEVVLEPPAAALLLDFLSYMGFGAKQMLEGESFLSSRRGEKVAADHVTVEDNVQHPLSVGIAFDLEGVPRKRVAVIESGRAIGPVTDLRTAAQLNVSPTGHFSGSNEFGPYASNVVMGGGEQARDDLVAEVEDGLLITRFHYVNVLDRPETLLTGMTRDGTYRIRNGEIAEPVRNLRFSQSVLAALASTLGIGSDAASFAPDFGSFGSTVAPSLRIGEFSFSSTTSH